MDILFKKGRSMRKVYFLVISCLLGFSAVVSAFGTEATKNTNNKNKPATEAIADYPAIQMVSAKDFGVVGDGVFENTAVLQAALDAAQEKGPICYLPSGHYRLDGSLVVPPGVTLQGASGGVPHSEHPIGTVLLAYGGKGKVDGEPLITLKPNAVIRNLIIHYPEQTLPDVVPYPWTIRGDGEMCQVIQILIRR